MNLIINASEAIGEKGGVIRIAASGPVAWPNMPGGEYLRLEISDTGCGMTADARARIFDPFYTTKFPGRGMGLAVVQGIVRDHHGVISLVSTPGRGTTFEIFLPCAAEPVDSIPAPIAPTMRAEGARTARSILFVEDEDMLREPLSEMLRKKGFQVFEANDGAAALELVRAPEPGIDLMLLDITLPGVSSREVFEVALDSRPDLKIVLTSAYSREAVAASFAGIEIEHFIRKPFRFEELKTLLHDVLSNGASAGAA
jgi:CheY-like chemotaxis protein